MVTLKSIHNGITLRILEEYKMRKITLTNNFHNTEVILNVKDGKNISANQVKKANKILCGYNGCLCSGYMGTRGTQAVEIEINQDGSAYINE